MQVTLVTGQKRLIPLGIKFQSLILIPFIWCLFCENFYDNKRASLCCTLCEVVQNTSGISQGNKDQNLIFYLQTHGKFFLFKTIISCILIGKME